MLIDMHVHTREGSDCSEISLKDTIKLLKEKKFDGLVITDHESDLGYKWYLLNKNENLEFLVLRGFEIMTRYGDMLVILPIDVTILDDEEVINQYIHPLELAKKVHELDGVIGIPHMFREQYSCIGTSLISKKDLERLIKVVDFIEIENGTTSESANKMAEELASRYEKKNIRGSDSHTVSEVGRCGTIFKIEIKSEEDLIMAIRKNLIKTVPSSSSNTTIT